MGAGSDVNYIASAWAECFRSRELRNSWESLFAQHDTSVAVYQSPAFFDYLQETDDTDTLLDVIVVRDRLKGAISGVVPVRQEIVELPFSIGERTLMRLKVNCLSVLGSEPMVPKNPDAFDSVFRLMLQHYPQVDAIDIDVVPQNSYLWNYINSSSLIRDNFDPHVVHGFRDCHSVAVPASLDDYYSRLTRKRRYNLARQEKLLGQEVGGVLELAVIEREDELALLFRAIASLGASPDSSEMDENRYRALARRGFLKSFVLKSGDRILGLALGTKSRDVLRIHSFFYDAALERHSPGMALWQAVLRNLITEAKFRSVDMGYGAPAYRHSATNTVQRKGKVLLFRSSAANRWRIRAHSAYSSTMNMIKARRESRAAPAVGHAIKPA